MAEGQSGELTTTLAVSMPQRRRLSAVWRFLRRKPLGTLGLVILLVLILMALFADVLAPYDPGYIHVGHSYERPNSRFLLGTDAMGRDVLSRIIFGARISLYVGILVVLFGTTSGAILGVVSGYFGGLLDLIVQRAVDALMAFPALVLALAIMATLGQSLNNVVVALSIVGIPGAARVLRSAALTVKERQYIEAARAIGCSHMRIVLYHVFPNCLAAYLVMASIVLGGAIVSEASLSFLGLGSPANVPSWGGMLKAGTQDLRASPWIAIFPGVALSLVVFGINVLGDALRDTLDPRLRIR